MNANGSGMTVQIRAKANPSIRQLALLKSLGSQAAVGSICAAQTKDMFSPDYGLYPSMKAIFEWFLHRGC